LLWDFDAFPPLRLPKVVLLDEEPDALAFAIIDPF
jgi:hypothetical protein